MEQPISFNAVLDAAETLTLDEKETLIDILCHRVAESGRQRLVEEVREARHDFAQGQCPAATPDEIMQELLS